MDFITALAETIAKAAGMPAEEVRALLETPPDPKMGDAALPCFKLAKTLRKAPPAIAKELARKSFCLDSAAGWKSRADIVFILPRHLLVEMRTPAAAGENWGKSDVGRGRTSLSRLFLRSTSPIVSIGSVL